MIGSNGLSVNSRIELGAMESFTTSHECYKVSRIEMQKDVVFPTGVCTYDDSQA